jgi:molybdate transport system permease protein
MPAGTAVAWLQARVAHPFRRVVDVLVLLPMVLPPTVVGFVLVLLFGRQGILGAPLESVLGIRLIFTPAAAVLASTIAALPVMVKAAQPAFESIPRELEDVGRSLGLSPVAVFFRVSLPAARRGLIVGVVLAFARAMGEFGATLMFAGNKPGRTNTMPLELFAAYQAGDDARALLYVVVLVVFAIGVAIAAGRLVPRAGT